jgi:hypothetical protein
VAVIHSSRAEFDDWAVVRKFLPAGWEEQAKLMGALRRTRQIESAEALLRILFLHLANGCSLVETAARAQASGLGSISSVGVFKRLRAAGPWLSWLAQQLRGPALLPSRRWEDECEQSMPVRLPNLVPRAAHGVSIGLLTWQIWNVISLR